MVKARLKDISKLVISIAVCEGAGLVGGLFTASAISTWYATLQKPSFTPPNWLFAPAWITLYSLMAIAAFIVWRKGLGNQRVAAALSYFLAQLVLNTLWSFAFFGLKSPVAGVAVIVGLWVAILITIVKFSRVSKVAGILMLPYILWVSFAVALNISIWILNPHI